MAHLEDVSAAELRRILESVSESRPTLRLAAAIAYKHGTTQTELADWYGVERKTVYNWLRRIDEADDVAAAVTDADRPGRPRKLPDAARRRLEDDLAASPRAVGYLADEWSPYLLEDHLARSYDTDYSSSSCRRLLAELRPDVDPKNE